MSFKRTKRTNDKVQDLLDEYRIFVKATLSKKYDKTEPTILRCLRDTTSKETSQDNTLQDMRDHETFMQGLLSKNTRPLIPKNPLEVSNPITETTRERAYWYNAQKDKTEILTTIKADFKTKQKVSKFKRKATDELFKDIEVIYEFDSNVKTDKLDADFYQDIINQVQTRKPTFRYLRKRGKMQRSFEVNVNGLKVHIHEKTTDIQLDLGESHISKFDGQYASKVWTDETKKVWIQQKDHYEEKRVITKKHFGENKVLHETAIQKTFVSEIDGLNRLRFNSWKDFSLMSKRERKVLSQLVKRQSAKGILNQSIGNRLNEIRIDDFIRYLEICNYKPD